MRRVFSVLLAFFFTHVITAFCSSNDPVKALPLDLMVLTTEGMFAGPCVITTVKPPSFDPAVAQPSVKDDKFG